MSEIQSGQPTIRATIEIKRAATGLVERHELILTPQDVVHAPAGEQPANAHEPAPEQAQDLKDN